MTHSENETRTVKRLVALGTASCVGYAVLSWLSWQFASEIPSRERPTLWMLAIFGVEFLCFWWALLLAIRCTPTKMLTTVIIVGACLFRTTMLPSVPMHEIDIYRYIWDGAVLAEGGSPYSYTPKQVLDLASLPVESLPQDLGRLVSLQSRSQSLGESLAKIHYGELPSPYPLVSQAVFAASALITPENVPTHVRLVLMKLVLTLFDVATLLVVIQLLRQQRMHTGWSLVYGWCPLMMKEVANGGHLDSIAIFFTTLAIWQLVRSMQVEKAKRKHSTTFWVGSALAMAIGAKLYPVILLPLFASVWWHRGGLRVASVGLVTTAIVSGALLLPLFRPLQGVEVTGAGNNAPPPHLALPNESPSAETQIHEFAAPRAAVDPSAGLREFINRWEMNDLIFMIVLENLRSQQDVQLQSKPWFVIVPDNWSRAVVGAWTNAVRSLRSHRSGEDLPLDVEAVDNTRVMKQSSFMLARFITGGVFFLVAVVLAIRAGKQDDAHHWCRAGMLTLAWFWLTCPTQNPWYWCWVLPLLPFARYRTWHVVAACSMLYYLRFWLMAHYPEPPVWGTPYNGANFFYFVVVWLEFGPCLALLVAEWVSARFRFMQKKER